MNTCIFCKSTGNIFNTHEHILPESLGGRNWAVLPDGLLCDNCQNRFGSSIEQQALDDYPFSFLRTFLGIPTKKGKPPWFESWEGTITASSNRGSFGYLPVEIFKKPLVAGQKSQIRLIAHSSKPEIVCRFLLKMGLETVASDNSEEIFNKKYDAARKYSLEGEKEDKWWYLLHVDFTSAANFFSKGVTEKEWTSSVSLQVTAIGDDAMVFYLKLLYLDMIVPLEARILPATNDLSEPEYSLVVVQFKCE